MKEESKNIEYFIIGIPKEIETITNDMIEKKTVIEEFFVALVDEIELYVLNSKGYLQSDNDLMLYDYAMLNEDGDNDIIRRQISKNDFMKELQRRRSISAKEMGNDRKVYKKEM